MSYTLRVEAASFDPADLVSAGASYRAIRGIPSVAWLAWRGNAARGVTVILNESSFECVLRTFSSEDDVALAVELVSLVASRAGEVIHAEDVPPDCESDGLRVTPQQLARWPKHWFAYQSFAGVEDLYTLKPDERLSFDTPGRRALVTSSLAKTLGYPTKYGRELPQFAAHRRTIDSDSLVSATQPFVEYLQWARPLLQLPTRPQFTDERLAVPKRLLFLTRGDRAPFLFLNHEPILSGDVSVSNGVPDLATHTTLTPEMRALALISDYATFEADDGWHAVPFDAVLRALGNIEHVDEHTIVFPKMNEKEWASFTAKLMPSVKTTLPKNNDYRLTTRMQLLQKHERFVFTAAEAAEFGAWHEAKSRGDPAEQDRRIDRLLILAPDRAEASYWRGVQRYREGRHAEARAALELANTREYADGRFGAEARNDLAILLRELGDADAARDALRFAIAHTPNDEDRQRFIAVLAES